MIIFEISPNDIMKEDPITTRINELNEQCSDENRLYCDIDSCFITLVIYSTLDLDSSLDFNSALDYLREDSKTIRGYLILIVYPNKDLIELIEMCILDTDIFKELISYIKSEYDNYNIWIAISPSLKEDKYINIVDILSSNGFGLPILTKNTGVFEQLDKPIISMTYYKDIESDIIKLKEYIKNTGIYIYKQYNLIAKQCKQQLYFDIEICEKIADYINDNREYAGIFLNIGYIDHHDDQYINMILSDELVVPGPYIENAELATVHNPPITKVTFHTHPDICYTINECYIGWPSGADMGFVLSNYPNMLKHYVFTKEGVYSIQLSLEMMTLMNKLLNLDNGSEIVNIITEQVIKSFTEYEKYRGRKVNLFRVLNEFMRNGSAYSINKLIEETDNVLSEAISELGLEFEYDFTIFILNFYTWKHVKKNKAFIDCFYYCEEIPFAYGAESNEEPLKSNPKC